MIVKMGHTDLQALSIREIETGHEKFCCLLLFMQNPFNPLADTFCRVSTPGDLQIHSLQELTIENFHFVGILTCRRPKIVSASICLGQHLFNSQKSRVRRSSTFRAL